MFASGCSNSPPIPDEKITDVVRIFMHDPNFYSFMVQDSSSSHLKMVSLHNSSYVAPVSFFADVPQGEKMWVLVHHVRAIGANTGMVFEIHIHAPRDVEGAGWNH